jgi:hypothetical protein
MELTDSLTALFLETARSLTGSARRLFMARTVKELGPGGQRRAERALGWSRVTIRQGTHELERGFTGLDAVAARGRKPVEASLPTLLRDMQAIVESQSQTDPQFRTPRLSTRLRAAEVRRQRIAQHGYADAALPTVQTLTTTRNALGSSPKKVAKSQPHKKSLQPTRSSPRSPPGITALIRRMTSCGSRGMPKPSSKAVPSPVVGRVGAKWRRRTTSFSRRHL